MTFIILGGIAFSVTVVAIVFSVAELWREDKEEDLFSTLPWGEIIEGRV